MTFGKKELLKERNDKLKIVKEFIDSNCNLAPQGSEEWLKTRQSIIGGSELSILIGKNPFSSIGDLVANKCNLSNYVGNMATKWGNVFEELTRIIIQMIFLPDISLKEECIYETGSLEGVIPHHRFSPDGLTVLMFKYGNVYKALIALLEFKSPLSSIPNGLIPPYYLPQVKAGMCDIDMSEIGLFVNNMFRKCSLSQFGKNPKYNTLFHSSDIKKKIMVSNPLAIGIIGLYQTKEQVEKFKKKYNYILTNKYHNDDYSTDEDTTEDVEQTITWKILNDHIDVGDLNEEDTLQIFQLISNKLITVKYFAPNVYIDEFKNAIPEELIHINDNIISFKSFDDNPKKFINSYIKKCKENEYNMVGYLPWKLFKSDLLLVEKEPLYIYQFVDKIEKVINIISDLCSIENIQERLNKFNEYFPRKNKICI